MARDIENGAYQHGGYRKVIVQEKKRRDLAVASIRDRVIHRLVYDELVALFDASLDPDVWSCRKDKGLHACLARTQKLLAAHKSGFIWRMDITKFFDHVEHETLKTCLRRRTKDTQILALCNEIIDSYFVHHSGQGIPIGNLTSQVFANIYLNEFDRFVRHTLKPMAYVRYGDDMVFFARTRREARYFQAQAIHFLRTELNLFINSKNNVIFSARQPLKFLGHVITEKYVVVDRATTKRVLERVNLQNIASYKSLHLAKWPKRQIDWLIVEQINETLD